MKRLFFFIFISLVGFLSTNAQVMGRIGDSGNADLYRTPSGRVRSPQEVAVLQSINASGETGARLNNLRTMADRNFVQGQTARQKYESDLKKAKKYVAPNASFQTEYQSFLKLPNTGIIRLLAEKTCEALQKDVLKQCPQNFIAGNGRYFSFRLKNYVHDKWADLESLNGFFVSNGADNQGILVNLGEVNPADLSLTSKGVEFLTNFVPAVQVAEVNRQYMQIFDEIDSGGYRYSKTLPIEVSKTYALRAVAYERDVEPILTEEQKRITKDPKLRRQLFDPLRDDTRQDVIVVFKVLEKNEGGTTILWRELQRKKSPYMEVNKENKS